MADVALREYVNEIDGMIENSAYDVAIQHCRHILSLYPKYLEVYRVLGKALLEKDDYAAAGDVFQRVISVDPEDFVARVGLSIVHDRQGDLDQAIWHMERAYDLMPSNEIIQSELRRLCGRRDGSELERVSLTRSALARMYANGDLTAEAIAHLQQLLHDQPNRVDLQILLAEVLWRDNQRIEASELAQAITAKLPYCLKANLLLGEILQASGSPDSETPFRRAQAVDPDNLQAAQLLGSGSPLPVRQTLVPRLEQRSYGQLLETEGTATDREEVPDWLRGLAELNTPMSQLEAPESATNPPLPTGLHMPGTEPVQGEIPDWLQGLTAPQPESTGPSQEVPDWLTALGTASMADKSAQSTSLEPAEDWLVQLQSTSTPEPATAMRDEDVPDWILQLGTGALDPKKLPQTEQAADETPDWMKQLGATGPLESASSEAPVAAVDDETPDWLRQLGNTGPLDQTITTQPAARSTTAASNDTDTPDWLAQLGQTAPSDQAAAQLTESEEMPDWLRQLGNTGPLEPTVLSSDAVDSPSDWLSQLQSTALPADQSATDETPDWLVQLGNTGPLPPIETPPARKISVDTDRATVERLVEAFSSSPAKAQEPVSAEDDDASFSLGDAATEIGKAGAGLVLGGAALTGAAVSGLADLAKGHADEEVAAPVESEPAALEAAAILEGDISPDDALAFFARLTAGKEAQLQAEAQAEGESRMAAIMGRKVEPVVEAKPVEPEPVIEPVAEIVVPHVAAPVESEPVAMEAAAILEGDISPDDALAFFARLTAGKEAQLQAEAQAEGESRMAAIMGRKVEPVVEAKPVEPEPVIEPVAETVVPHVAAPVESEPVAVEAAAILEGDISPDDALAFFARLTAGKEAQLQAEAQAEGESRMAAIMGRKVEPVVEAKPVESEPVIEPVAEIVVPPVEREPVAVEAAAILEGDIRPDDALAFFARLTAGKEAQLQAEAQAEGESRMAAIMGRKVEPVVEAKPVESEPVIEPVAEIVVPPVESEPNAAEAAAILEGDISPDDALAFFARLTAGKESQLQAEAQAEGESRMAAIMGRKVEPVVEAKSVEPELVPSVEPEPEEVASDDTTDWLAQLSAAAALAAAEPATESSDEEPVDWLKGLGEPAPVAAAAEELPDWLRAMRPPDESLAAESTLAGAIDEIEATPAEALPDWLRAMQPAVDASTPTEAVMTEEFSAALDIESEEPVAELAPASDLPAWLQDLQPSAAAAELTPAESLPDWLRNLQPETVEAAAAQTETSEPVVMDLPQAEDVPVVAEAVTQQPVAQVTEGLPEPIITPVRTLVQSIEAVVKPEPAATPIMPTWWTQSAEDEGEMPIAELPEPVRMASATARVTATPSAPTAAAPRPPITRAMRDRLPERLTREPRRREVRSAEPRHTEAHAPVVSSVNVDPLVEQLEEDKFNHAVRLELARAWWSMGNRESALAEYGKLINPAQVENLSDEELAEIEERDFADAGPLADDLIVDLERIVEIDDQPAWSRLLGDLHMKTGDLARALELYRRALSQL